MSESRINQLEDVLPKFKKQKKIDPKYIDALEWELKALKLESKNKELEGGLNDSLLLYQNQSETILNLEAKLKSCEGMLKAALDDSRNNLIGLTKEREENQRLRELLQKSHEMSRYLQPKKAMMKYEDSTLAQQIEKILNP